VLFLDELPEFDSKTLEVSDCSLPSIAVIGARDCSIYGNEVARSYAKELARCGVQIMSGLACGIDGQAHWGALEAKGKTFGVIGKFWLDK
jgi:DNA processing protein